MIPDDGQSDTAALGDARRGGLAATLPAAERSSAVDGAGPLRGGKPTSELDARIDAASQAVTQAIIDSTIDVVTPENIAFQYQVAGPFRRLPAFLIDLLVRTAIWAGALVLAVMLSAQLGGSPLRVLGFTVWVVLWFVLEWFYGGILETYWNGQTVGKRIMQVRVLRTDGQPVNGMQAITRNVLRLVDLMPLVPLGVWEGTEGPYIVPTGMIGLAAAILSPRYQRLGDLVCGTMVVVEGRRNLVNTSKLMEQPELRKLIARLPPNFVASRKLSNALGNYIERRRHFTRGRRIEIARHLAPLLLNKLELEPNIDPDLLLCALYSHVFVAKGPAET